MKKAKKQILRALFILSFISFLPMAKAQKIHVNKEWRDEHGDPVFNPLLSPYGGDWTKSIISSINGEIITVAHTFVSGQGENILLTRYQDNGSPAWQIDFNSSSTDNDYGIDLIEDPNTGDIYVCGTTDNGGVTNYDVLILIYDASGNLLYDTRYDGPESLNDIPGAIKIDSNGHLVIAGTSESSSTLLDYLMLNYDVNLNLNWFNTYDYANLNDVAVALEISGGKVKLAGGSANSLTDVDMTLVDFDESDGSFIADNRMNYPGFGYDEVTSFRKDATGNFYVTGKCSSNGTDYDIRVAKVDNTNTLLWSQTYDGFNLEDVGTTIAVDGSGNVIVGGFSTKANNKKEMIILKYNSSGTLQWKHTQSSNDPSSDALVKAISLNQLTDNIYFIGGEKEFGGSKRAVVARVNTDGRVAWEKYIKGNYDYLPSDIQYGGFGFMGVYAIAIKDSTPVNAYEINLFTEHELDSTTIYASGGTPICPKRQLITMFDTSAIIKSMIDNKNIVCGQIESFVKSGVVSELKNNLGAIYGINDFEIKVFKIFPELTTKDTTTTSRLDETIRIPEFYSMLLLELPDALNIASAANSMESLFPNIVFTHPNYICTLLGGEKHSSVDSDNNLSKITAVSNDSLYFQCSNLHATSTYPNAHVNAEEAWDYETGKRHVKVGVFDTGCFHGHRDFMDSTKTVKKITGWDFYNNTSLLNDAIGEGLTHGTNVSGIIAANRNNHIGIPGIAAGNFKKNNSYLDSSGINLHGMRILSGGGHFNSTNYLNYVTEGMVMSTIYDPASSTNVNYKYGLHIQNHSWRIGLANSYTILFLNDSNITLLREACHFVNRAHVTNVCATGNEYNGNTNYPVGIDDDWIISVGGSGPDGKWDYTQASYKNNIDLIAPSHYYNVWTTGWAGGEWQDQPGTSMSAPHVAGTAALLMSYYNKPTSHPDNLAPEDVEYVLQETATDVNAIGPDDTTGHGRLNIGKALKYISKPRHRIRHIGTNTCYHYTTLILSDTNEVVKLTERYKNAAGQWFKPNTKYILRTYRVLSFIYDTLSPTDSVKGMWWRHSSSNVLEHWNNGKLRPRERLNTLNYLPGLNQWSTEGHIYHVRDSLGNFLGWWPFDTSNVQTKMQLTLSVLIKDTAFDVGVKDHQIPNHFVKVYPNPTSGSQILEINSNKSSRCRVDIYDMLGRSVFSQENIKVDEGNNKIPIPTNGFPNGMYIYNVKLDEEHYYYKILKQ